MAYLEENDKLLDPNQQNQAQATGQGQNLSSGGDGGGVVEGGAGAAGNVSTAGIGAGGTNRWTNIQSYLNANQNNAGSANALNQEVGSQFQNEKKQITDESSKLKDQAKTAADNVTGVYNQAGQLLDQGAKAYNWDAEAGDEYTQAKNKLQSAMNQQYSGPRQYAYGISDKTQNLGQTLGNDNAFNQYMGDMYQKKSGGQLSGGGRELQKQLDVNNDYLNSARQNLMGQYSGLSDYVNTTAKDTNDSLNKSENDYRTNQSMLRDYLSNQAGSLDSTIGQQESGAKNEFDQSMASRNNPAWAQYLAPYAQGNTSFNEMQSSIENEYGGRAGLDAAYAQGGAARTLAAQNAVNPNLYNAQAKISGDIYDGLQHYYTDQNTKYANTADPEKRKWNLIEDVLGNSARKNKGFKVRS